MGREAMEAVEAAKAMHAAERRMESTAAHMKAASSSASAKVKAALRHCRGIRGNAERTDRNAGRQNRYRSFDGSFHGRFPTLIVPAAAMSRWARIQSTLVLNCSHLLRVFSIQLFSPIAGFQMATRRLRINFPQSLQCEGAPAANHWSQELRPTRF
jgi:hypothetical protein